MPATNTFAGVRYRQHSYAGKSRFSCRLKLNTYWRFLMTNRPTSEEGKIKYWIFWKKLNSGLGSLWESRQP